METEKIEALAPEEININKASAEVLRSIIDQQRKAMENYELKLKDMEERGKKELEDCINFYTEKLKETTALNNYYERKLNIIANIALLEQSLKGDKKND